MQLQILLSLKCFEDDVTNTSSSYYSDSYSRIGNKFRSVIIFFFIVSLSNNLCVIHVMIFHFTNFLSRKSWRNHVMMVFLHFFFVLVIPVIGNMETNIIHISDVPTSWFLFKFLFLLIIFFRQIVFVSYF